MSEKRRERERNFASKITPTEVEAGKKIRIECHYWGNLNFGFFDVVMLDEEQKYEVWMPDRRTWNSYRDTGILSGKRHFSTRWYHFIPDWIPEGEYKFLVLVYDDKTGKNSGMRRPIKMEEHRIVIRSSNHPEAIIVRKFYNRFLERIPDIRGYRTWFENLQIKKASRKQVLEIGFLRCDEFRARFIHKLLLKGKIGTEEIDSSIKLLRRYPLSKLVKEKYPNVINSNEELKELVRTTYRLDEKAVTEMEKIVDSSLGVEENLELIINNFLIEKYILINYLFPKISDKEFQEKVQLYLTNPEEIIRQL